MLFRSISGLIFSVALVVAVGCGGSTEVEVIEQEPMTEQDMSAYEAEMEGEVDKSYR